MKLQKGGINFLVNSLTNVTIVLDTPAPQLSSSSLLKPSRAFPQNNNHVFIYLVLHNQSGKSSLDSLQCRAGFSTSALKGFTAGQKPFFICIPNWFSFPVWPDQSCIPLIPPGWGWAWGAVWPNLIPTTKLQPSSSYRRFGSTGKQWDDAPQF